jgi:DNA-binding SARP family transcriptional activator
VIEARVLGPAEISLVGGATPPELLWRKNLALLVYLARSPRRRRAREHLLGLLWPEKPEASARHSLNEALRVIRRYVGDGAVTATADHIALAPEAVHLDVDAFETFERTGDWKHAARLVAGAFLEGFAVPGASELEDWLAAERRLWGTRAANALVRAAAEELDAGHASDGTALARRAVAIDPFSESAARILMRCLALDGDRGAALQEYDALGSRLAALGAKPEEDTIALAERIRRERARRPPSPGSPHVDPRSRRAPLVGRKPDLERLWHAWEGAREAGTAMIGMIAGEPGVGKTRLAEEIGARMRLAGASTALLRAVESDLGAPWSGILGLARGGLLEGAGVATAPPNSLAWFGSAIPDWGDRFPASRRVSPAPPTQAFCDVLQAILAEQPLALLVDDAAWIDRESLLAIDAALRDLAKRPLTVVLTLPDRAARPELDQLQSRIGRDLAGLVVRLAALSTEEIRRLARWAVPRYSETEIDRLARRVATDSAGLPLLVVELLTAVAVGLDLARVQGAWPEPLRTLDQTLPGDLPEAVVGAIRAGYWRLSAAAQHVLQAAAVLEIRCAADRLVRATGLSSAEVADALDELEWSRWLAADGQGYTFVARIVREVVAGDLVTAGQRQRLRDAAGGFGGPP